MSIKAVCISHCRNDAGQHEVAICYCGWADELIALGVATADMLGRKVKGKKRVDADGDRFQVSWYWRLDDNRQPKLCYKLTRVKPVEVIDHLPLARDAIAKHLRLLEQERSRAQKDVDQGRGNNDFQDWMQQVARSAAKQHRELTRALMPPSLRDMVSKL
jgi:hypothetical protein